MLAFLRLERDDARPGDRKLLAIHENLHVRRVFGRKRERHRSARAEGQLELERLARRDVKPADRFRRGSRAKRCERCMRVLSCYRFRQPIVTIFLGFACPAT